MCIACELESWLNRPGKLSKEGLIYCLKAYDEDKEIDDLDDILVNVF